MKKTILTIIPLVMFVAILSGCGPSAAQNTGFLSDYSRLQKESDSSLRYVNERALKQYSAFIVDPVQARLGTSRSELTQQQLSDLKNYTHSKIIEAVKGAGKRIAYQPGSGVARIRVALTDLEKTGAINMLPQASLLGAGVGGASMEAEVVDSVSDMQIGAVVESKQGSRIPFSNLGDWTAAKGVIDSWATRFQERLTQ
jgi:hypothetical protein